ncbi:MAG TPA: hypothetical protein VHH35_08175, partial [Pyrinomonadaceae bacterium]|nr:hypothetical protein [Pyrinomonadaceae bacterium]
MKRILLVLIAVVLIAGGASAAWVYTELRRPIAHNKSGQYIEIPRGSSPSSIVKKLAAEGVIKHEWPLMLYL